MGIKIDSYYYCNDKSKENYYRNHIHTPEEEEKTKLLMAKMSDFLKKVMGEESLMDFKDSLEGRICFFDGIGYISHINTDRDIVDVYYYGKTVDEAFFNAIIDYEFSVKMDYEQDNRKKLNEQYSERFLNNVVSKNDYHGPFFFAELALQDFRKFYGNNIPKEIIDYYEKYLIDIYNESYKYDYDTNSFVKKEKILHKKDTRN